MNVVEKKLKKAEMVYERERSGKNALALFACYILAGRTIDPDGIYLSKAYHVAVSAHKEDLLDTKIIGAVLYASILLDNLESAGELISQLEVHSTFLSKNFPLFYGQVLYFNSIVQAKTEKSRSARKIHRNLELIYEKTEHASLIALMGSIQKLVFGDAGLCAKMYYEAMRKGLRSVYFFLDIYDILVTQENYTDEMNELARIAVPWALDKGLPVDMILARLEKRTLIGVLFSLDAGRLSTIYSLYGHPGAFQCLCQKLIYEGDTTERALLYYMDALNNNLSLRGLEQISIKAAYENGYCGLPVSLVEAALETPEDYDLSQLAFLFGIAALKRGEATQELMEKMVNFGVWARSEGMRGKDFNQIYKFLFDIFPNDGKFAAIISEELFKYEIEFSGQTPASAGVYEYSRRGVSVYAVESGKAYINAIGDFECYFLGEDAGEYLDITGYKITKALELEKPLKAPLYETLYQKGFNSPELIIALATEYLEREALTENETDILRKAADTDIISDNLRLDIFGRLAENYASQKQYGIAVHYFGLIGESGIKPEMTGSALNTFIATGRYKAAASLIMKKRPQLSDADVFNSLKVLGGYADSPEIASMCHELVLKDFFGPEILSILLKSFRGTPAEWLAAANKIDSLGFDVSQLYEKIIVNGIFTGSIGNDCNEAFIKLYAADKKHTVIPRYIYFCCYEIIKNGKTIPDNLADLLSEIYLSDDKPDSLLSCALAVNYIRSGRQDKTTLISEAAAELEEEGIVLPEFKQYQDKSFISSYIEKNTPFIYTGATHKNMYFCYKSEELASFVKKKMKYFRFGIYAASIPLFYGDKITYYFEEENGSATAPETFTKTHLRLIEQFNDPFYTINNAAIYGQIMKYDMMEALIEERLASNEQFPVIIM